MPFGRTSLSKFYSWGGTPGYGDLGLRPKERTPPPCDLPNTLIPAEPNVARHSSPRPQHIRLITCHRFNSVLPHNRHSKQPTRSS